MSGQSLVSVGLPTYNRAASLRRAIESVLVQDYQNIELLISDNASTDETEALCLDAARRDRRIKYVRQQTNQGGIANFHEVLKQSAGEFFMWLADDDWLDQSYLRQCVRVLSESSDYSLVCGKSRYFDQGEFVNEGLAIDLLQEQGSDRVLGYYGKVADNGTFYGLMRRSQILQVPLQKKFGGDWFVVAGIAFMGKIKTLESTCVNRNLGGAAASFEKIAAALGLSSFAVKHPNLTIAGLAFGDIVWRCPAYSGEGIFSRLWLGVRVFALIADRGKTLFGRGTYSGFLPRRLAFTIMSRVLPADKFDKIRAWRRKRRAVRAGQ